MIKDKGSSPFVVDQLASLMIPIIVVIVNRQDSRYKFKKWDILNCWDGME